jgi:hypothetical protein
VKLDKDLVRDILLALEADNEDPFGWKDDLSFDGHTDAEVAYHICILAEGGYVTAMDLSSMDGDDWRAQRLTYEGHEFLDTIRDGEVWKLTKDTAKKAGVGSLKLLFEVGKSYAKQKLVEHGVHLG